MIKSNYQLYARVLRLWLISDHPSFDWHGNCGVEGIVRDVIYPDPALIWC